VGRHAVLVPNKKKNGSAAMIFSTKVNKKLSKLRGVSITCGHPNAIAVEI